jgi:hypothetical protein
MFFNILSNDLKWKYTLKSQNIMTTPTFCNEFAWMTWKARDQVEVVFYCYRRV